MNRFLIILFVFLISTVSSELILKTSRTVFGPYSVTPHDMYMNVIEQTIMPQLPTTTKIGIKKHLLSFI